MLTSTTTTLPNRIHKNRLELVKLVATGGILKHKVCFRIIQIKIKDEFISIIDDLKNMDVKIEEEDQTRMLLCSLLSSYKHF